MIQVVMDTSSLISLEIVGSLEQSLEIVDINIPKAVVDEINELAKYKDRERKSAENVLKLIEKGGIKTIGIKNQEHAENLLSRNVNRGEAECFVSCSENNIKKLIMDDVDAGYSLEGQAIANKIEIKISLAVLMELYFQNRIDKEELKKLVEKLIKAREWEGGVLKVLSKVFI